MSTRRFSSPSPSRALSLSLRSAALAFAFACVLAPASSSHAYQVTGSRWDTRALPIRYRVNANSAPASLGATAALNAVQQGFAAWAAPTCTAWRTQYDGVSTVTLARTDGVNSVLWLASGWNSDPRNNPMGDVRGTIGVTQTSSIVGGGTNESDISFNAQMFTWSTTGNPGTVDAQSIATHEEGHFLGLDHSPITSAIMYASYSSGMKRVLHSDDTMGVCALYPSGVTTPDAGPRDTGTPDTGTPPTGLGSDCADTGECSGAQQCVCRDRAMTDCFCSQDCSRTVPCPTGFTCASTSSGGLCIPDPAGMTMMPGTGATGDACTAGTSCASGICVRGQTGAAFCTQACANDCSCPTNYTCAMTTAGTNVCAPGTNTCASTTPDAGVRDTGPRDTGTPPEEDAATTPTDAGTTPMEAGADAGTGGTSPGCGCVVPGAGMTRGAGRSAWSVPWALLALAGAVRFRARKRR